MPDQNATPATNNHPSMEAIRIGIRNTWGDSISATMALRVVDAISNHEITAGDSLRLLDVIEVMEAPGINHSMISALAILTQSRYAVLRSGGELVHENGNRKSITSEEFQKALNSGIESDKIYPVFRVTKDSIAA